MSQEKKCVHGGLTELCRYCNNIDENDSSPIVEEKEGLEIKLKKTLYEFADSSTDRDGNIDPIDSVQFNMSYEPVVKIINELLAQTLAEQRERLVKKIDDYRVGWADSNEENNCCREIINIIKNNK